MSDKNKWGGKRQGSGRPSTLQKPVRVTIWLEASQVEWLDSQGEKGEVIRRLIDKARVDSAKKDIDFLKWEQERGL